jgi:hypothetical protein
VQGGFLAEARGNTQVLGFAVRAGYSKTIGSEGGAFGAYLSGAYFLGGTLITAYAPDRLSFQGDVTFDVTGSGGVYVFGMRWDILSVGAHVGVSYYIGVVSGAMHTQWGGDFDAWFRVCITPCSCVSGSVTFQQGMNENQATSYNPPQARIDRLLDLLEA